MLNFFAFLFYTFPLMLSCLYTLVALFIAVVHIRIYRNQKGLSKCQWIVLLLNIAYILLFLTTLVFFVEFWKNVFSTLGIVAILISLIWSRYEEKRNGRRWWNW